MGGFGSGRRPWKKRTVEECRRLDANGWLVDGVRRAGTHNWHYLTGFTVHFQLETKDPEDGTLLLRHGIGTLYGREEVAYRVRLTPTRQRLGGLRWWFRCPLTVGGRPCGRRVGKLYLPPGGLYFGCRHCHRLTYKSCQEHDARVDWLRRHPEALAAIEADLEHATPQQIGLAVKAI